MKFIKIFGALAATILFCSNAYSDQQFEANQMLADLESKLQLSGEKLDKLKPVVDAKSAELQESIHASVDKGFMQLEALSTQLDQATRVATEKLSTALSSEEVQQVKDYLEQLDGEAMNEIRDELVAQLSEFLKLTEDQLSKLKPVLEDSFNRLGEMLDQLKKDGISSLEEFKSQYQTLNSELKQKLKDTLDSDQLKALDEHGEELQESIRQALNFS